MPSKILTPITKNLSRILDRVTYLCFVISAIMIALMSFISTYGALRRYLFHSPDAYAYVGINITMVVAVVLSVAYTQRERQHIRADYIINSLPNLIKEILYDIIGPLFGLGFVGVFIWQSGIDAFLAFQDKQKILAAAALPSFPIKIIIVIGLGLLWLVLLSQLIFYIVSSVNRLKR